MESNERHINVNTCTWFGAELFAHNSDKIVRASCVGTGWELGKFLFMENLSGATSEVSSLLSIKESIEFQFTIATTC